MAEPWWKSAVLYQIYPRSFQDSNGDGIGDLRGIIKRVPYLADLGVDAIWVSPIFVSPMADFGYDIANYTAIDPLFGSMDDFDAMVREAHAHGIKLVLDFVPNHTSDRHPWFAESRASRNNRKRDWYIWRDGRPEGGPPNNWLSEFGGSAWTFDAATAQYYYHAFLAAQPDLNWRNAELRAAMQDVMRFWLRRGVDGFRIDVMDRVVKDPELRDNPPQTNPRYRALAQTAMQVHQYDQNWPDIIDVVRGIRKVVDEFPERMTVGEVGGPPEQIVKYYGTDGHDGLHLAFNFPFVRVRQRHWTAEHMRRVVDAFEGALTPGAWPNHVFGNHDVGRFVSRVNDDGRGQERARVAALLLLTLRGTPFIYYGEEIGMEDGDVPEELLQDPARFFAPGRDPERTPMQWTRSGDFTSGTPWLPYSNLRCNVADEMQDPKSLLALYRRLIWFRRGSNALRFGEYKPLDNLPPSVFAYTRTDGDERLLTVLNFANEHVRFALPDGIRIVEMVIGTHGELPTAEEIPLAGNEGRLLRLS